MWGQHAYIPDIHSLLERTLWMNTEGCIIFSYWWESQRESVWVTLAFLLNISLHTYFVRKKSKIGKINILIQGGMSALLFYCCHLPAYWNKAMLLRSGGFKATHPLLSSLIFHKRWAEIKSLFESLPVSLPPTYPSCSHFPILIVAAVGKQDGGGNS